MTRTDPPRTIQPALILGLTAVFVLVAVIGALLLLRPASLVPDELGGIPEDLDGVGLEILVEGLDRPLALAFTGEPGQMFVGQQAGLVHRVEGQAIQAEPLLDLTDRVGMAGEKGFLGLALHPEFAENGRFYVTYTSLENHTILAEYTAPDGLRADPASERVLLDLEQESDFHKGGSLAFAADGTLFVTVGDDAWPRGTTPDYSDNFRGSIIRIDVDERTGDKPYGIPEGNAFAEGEGPPEVWDYGFRNPWRMSIDPESGDLYVGDVGAERFEELDRHRGGEPPGLDFGWGAWEANECRRHHIREELNCDEWADAEKPIVVFKGSEFKTPDCAIIGGFVYRGDDVPAFRDQYVFSDFCSGRIRIIPTEEEEPVPDVLLDADLRMSTFGMDSEGELYIADVATGIVYRLIAADRPEPTPSASASTP
ncbi:MAG TPA: PQQ-dependent sugar dehydrogenase [Candidatus Limnocylindrales bacterium]|nr:PQQ-dependent sugar dehydrogenase [Candidatus Limnocylindrales bacterium]